MRPTNTSKRNICDDEMKDGLAADVGVSTGRIPGVAVGASATGATGGSASVDSVGGGAAADALEAEKKNYHCLVQVIKL